MRKEELGMQKTHGPYDNFTAAYIWCDLWANGDTVVIQRNRFRFIDDPQLAKVGISGLVHERPFGEATHETPDH